MAFSTGNNDDQVLSEINITPLVDVMLVLLVAFILTAPLLNNAIHVNLPKTARTAALDDKRPLTISIDDHGKVFFDKREVPADTVETELRAQRSHNAELAVVLQGDTKVPYGSVARVMAAIERAGISRVSVVTDSHP
ncbi:biopolymer transport ExbD/TolR family protein [Paraburkholderia xenovorans LB400]|uniref:Outer membrane transport energization protein ExbD n=1 Tax=Paraburkholderia xenovorans (strain LB400) TaxID=266265 RepID=Q13IE0_PARXL|nr:biopolymer transporter ExbD [Paraburkholderia xenovorans]ABE36149.1 outer membrane transport energization protein ExbD [Paraburkholderia xenovorans LB400]AIP35023.1 biopolymer transport ExbD/TolR family protein [Paraburkholderia xenovorans LB400]